MTKIKITLIEQKLIKLILRALVLIKTTFFHHTMFALSKESSNEWLTYNCLKYRRIFQHLKNHTHHLYCTTHYRPFVFFARFLTVITQLPRASIRPAKRKGPDTIPTFKGQGCERATSERLRGGGGIWSSAELLDCGERAGA